MKLVVGLGNPGKEYENTRHNVGFMVLDNYLKNKQIIISKSKFKGEYAEYIVNNEKVIFFKPMEYINLSGKAISKIIRYYKIGIDDVLIIHDDLDIPLGEYKLKPKGNDGGHNGIKSIIMNTATNNIKRMKIGISNNKEINTRDYVLGKFNEDELKKIKEIIEVSEKIIDDFINLDFILVMNKYN